jgi:hypothetical protein
MGQADGENTGRRIFTTTGWLIDGEAARRDGDCSQGPPLEYGDKYERPERPNLTFRCKSRGLSGRT